MAGAGHSSTLAIAPPGYEMSPPQCGLVDWRDVSPAYCASADAPSNPAARAIALAGTNHFLRPNCTSALACTSVGTSSMPMVAGHAAGVATGLAAADGVGLGLEKAFPLRNTPAYAQLRAVRLIFLTSKSAIWFGGSPSSAFVVLVADVHTPRAYLVRRREGARCTLGARRPACMPSPFLRSVLRGRFTPEAELPGGFPPSLALSASAGASTSAISSSFSLILACHTPRWAVILSWAVKMIEK